MLTDVRLFCYYVIFLLFWQCPYSSKLSDSSSTLCFPLHNLLHRADPYISPYYQEYAAPYVDIARPYTDQAQKVFQSRVAEPVISKSSQVYVSHIQPVVVKNSEKLVVLAQPVTDKFTELYSLHIGPLRYKATEFCKQYVRPTWDFSATHLHRLHVYVLTPAYYKVSHYTYTLVKFAQVHILPKAKHYGKIVGDFVYTYVKLSWKWIVGVVSPKVSSVYERTIEPQVNKIIDRIFQGTESILKSTTSGTSATSPDSPTPTVGATDGDIIATAESAFSTDAKAEAESVPSSAYSHTEQKLDEATDYDEDLVVQATLEKAPQASLDITSELKAWKKRVDKTTKDAFDAFEREISVEKSRLVKESQPQFTALLRELQKYQQHGFAEFRKAIADMESVIHKYEDPATSSIDEAEFPWSHESVQKEYKQHTENIGLAVLAVRKYAQNLTSKVQDQADKIRMATIDVLDEFSDIALQELGRKMVSDSAGVDGATAAAGDKGKATWNDWKEFRVLKEHLIKTRDELTNYAIPMEDLRKVLGQALNTADVLAEEATLYLNQLKGKADHLLIVKIKKDEEKKKAEGIVVAEEEPDYDIIYYEDLEEDPKESKDTKAKKSEIKEDEEEEEDDDEEEDEEDDDDEDGDEEDDEEGDEDEEDEDEDDITEVLTKTRTRVVTVTSSAARDEL